jgi:nitroimidazol reductase NimA-like FMN-containing flavoprotein (pyridoxamine 5'-phosphate oxidase superfamily)
MNMSGKRVERHEPKAEAKRMLSADLVAYLDGFGEGTYIALSTEETKRGVRFSVMREYQKQYDGWWELTEEERHMLWTEKAVKSRSTRYERDGGKA